jgi:hypothetical protein
VGWKKRETREGSEKIHIVIPILSGAISPDTQDFQYNFSLKK